MICIRLLECKSWEEEAGKRWKRSAPRGFAFTACGDGAGLFALFAPTCGALASSTGSNRGIVAAFPGCCECPLLRFGHVVDVAFSQCLADLLWRWSGGHWGCGSAIV